MDNERTIRIASGDTFRKVAVIDRNNPSLPFEHIVLESGSCAEISILILPGVSCKPQLRVDLVGEGARADLSGIYVCKSDEKVELSVELHHLVPRCTSSQLFKGIAAGSSKVGFYGKIVVAQDAQKTEAYQENHNLLLSDEAKADTKPQLEIYADDVNCSHGATIGRLNEEEQFYMRSRGIPLEEARVLQMVSFLSPVLDKISDEKLKAEISSCLTDELRNMR